MSNVLKAILNIAELSVHILVEDNLGRNRINNVGKGLETFIADIFAGTVDEKDQQKRLQKQSQIYAYAGNQNNPPDLILKNGDAIEIKKIQSASAALALNSSYPKAKLLASNPMITKACRECEAWDVKDIIYVIGSTNDSSLRSLWMVYGDCYAADQEIYERVKTKISEGINTITNVEFSTTKELGKVKRIDPLGITGLRIRGMWHIEHPQKVFAYLDLPTNQNKFQCIVLMTQEKYLSFPEGDRHKIQNHPLIAVEKVQIKNPNNPVQLLEGIMITHQI